MGEEQPKVAKPNPGETQPKSPRRFNPSNWSKNVLISGIIVLLAVLGILIYLLVHHTGNNGNQNSNHSNTAKGLTATVSGRAEISPDGKNWHEAAVAQQIEPGSYVRSLKGQRSLVVFSSKNLVRLDKDTSVRLDSLNSTDATMSLLSGHTYVRSIDNSFRDHLNDQGALISTKAGSYQAYTESGKAVVESYVGTVQVDSQDSSSTTSTVINAGELFSEDKTEKLVLAKLQKDEFLLWNITRDKHNPVFNNKLGILGNIKVPLVLSSSQAATLPKGAVMKLSGRPVGGNQLKLSWEVSGLPKDAGVDLLFSRTTAKPALIDTRPRETEVSFFPVARKGSFTWKYPDGKTIWFRLCAYNDYFGQETLGCGSGASNIVSYHPQLVASQIVQAGDIKLSANGTVLSWTHTGTAPNGFYVVGPSEYDYVHATKSSSEDIKDLNDYYSNFYVCKKGYYEFLDCSNEVYIKRS